MLKLKKFPLCGTSNHLYMPFRGRLIKTQQARSFDQLIHIYKIKSIEVVANWKRDLGPNSILNVDCVFVFKRERIYTKKHTIKKLDTSNRLKQTLDGLAIILDIDDSRFVSGSYSKSYCASGDEYVDIEISETEMREFK